MLLTSNVLLFNAVLSLDDRLPKTMRESFVYYIFLKPKYISHRIMYISSTAVTELLRYPEIIGIPIKLFLIPTWQYKLRLLIVFK